MIILKLKAGLGNQMFQYAYAKALQLRSEKAYGISIPLKLDLFWFDHQTLSRGPKRFYGLNHFNIQADIATEKDIEDNFRYTRLFIYRIFLKIVRKVQRDILGFSDYLFYPGLFKPVKKAYIDSYFWNSESYFKDFESEIRKDFSLREPLSVEAASAVLGIQKTVDSGSVPVLLSVRRGDYANNPYIGAYHGAKDQSWYLSAVDKMVEKLGEENITFWVTTDDVDWVKENVKPIGKDGKPIELKYISRVGMKDYEEIYVMSLCHHFIISNSTFHWWGAWLSTNKEKVVIGPKKWVNNPKINTRDVMPPEWIRI